MGIEKLIYKFVDLPQCDACNGKPLDEKYQKAGDELAKAPLIVALTFGAGLANWKADGIISGAEMALRKAGYTEYADEVGELTTINAVKNFLERTITTDVKWENQNGQTLCYKCK